MIISHILLILIFLTVHAFFAGIETGIISIHRLRLQHYIRKGSKTARVLEIFSNDFDRLLGTTLVGTNLCVVMNSVLAASMALQTGLPGAQATSSVIISITVIIFCEYIPKAWFQARPIDRCQRFATTLLAAEWLLRPFSFSIIAIAKLLSPGKRTFYRPTTVVSRDDLKVLAREGEMSGVLSSKERYMIHRVIELSSTKVSQIMTPLSEMVSVKADMPLTQLYDIARDTGLTRFPVQNATGEYTGTVNVCYILSILGAKPTGKVEEYVRPTHILPANTKVDAVLPRMRRARQPLSLVQDDGEIVGLVTTEDVLRVIVGSL
jgi:CBS domain containing-hemolysin-like protein